MVARHQRRLSQLVEYPIQWLEMVCACACVHAPPVCSHIWRLLWYPYRQPVLSGELEGSLLRAGPAEAMFSFPQLKVPACIFYIQTCRSWSSLFAASQLALKHRLLVPDAAWVRFLLWKVCRSHFFQFHRTPQQWKMHQESVWICHPALSIEQAAVSAKTSVERFLHDPKGPVTNGTLTYKGCLLVDLTARTTISC